MTDQHPPTGAAAFDWAAWIDGERQAAEGRVGPDGDPTTDERYDYALLVQKTAVEARRKLAVAEAEARRMTCFGHPR